MLKSTYTKASGAPALPPGWSEHKAPTGHKYYYNAETKQSTYTRPSVEVAPQQPLPNPSFAANTPFGPQFQGFPAQGYPGTQFPGAGGSNRGRGDFRGGRGYQERRPRRPEDRPKSKHAIPDCAPWVLVKTKLGRRFVHNTETNESFWKFPESVLKGVVEYDRLEREKKERRERGEESEEEVQKEPAVEREDEPKPSAGRSEQPVHREEDEGSDEYEEVEVTDDEDEQSHPKRARTEEPGDDQPVEFNEEDIAYQLEAMGEDYGLDQGEYGYDEEGEWEEGAEGLPLTDEDSNALFRDLLDDFQINPYTTWEMIIEDGKIIEDDRYTALPNMKSRREAWGNWSRDKIQQIKEQKEKEIRKDPRIRYLAFLQEFATPKLYWPEFKRKYKKEAVMKDSQLTDKEREKFYRDHISRTKLPESTRKSDLSSLLQSIPIQSLNRSSTVEALPAALITDLRYISLSPKVRDPLIEAYISTLPPPPEPSGMSVEEEEEMKKAKQAREKREKALADREKRVRDEKRKQKEALLHGKDMLRHGEEEIQRAMAVGKDGLRSYIEPEERGAGHE
ncbi:hypothetical protein FQN54_008145 [Arachnomyces sp. PD_36]|nr:hypothetical protein FQN54_008145 [Arachnomyces sp. PD_36]